MFRALRNMAQRNNLTMFDVHFIHKIELMQNAFTHAASLVVYASASQPMGRGG